jgi:hypothetical protein
MSGSAVRTGANQLPSYAGAVAIYGVGEPPPGAIDLGVVEVHALQQEGTVDALLPMFVRKVASIGGNIAVIDGVRARFDFVGRNQVETFYYTCGTGATCGGTRVYSSNDEVMIVSMFGRAMTTKLVDVPLLPTEPPPDLDGPLPDGPPPQPQPPASPAPLDIPLGDTRPPPAHEPP